MSHSVPTAFAAQAAAVAGQLLARARSTALLRLDPAAGIWLSEHPQGILRSLLDSRRDLLLRCLPALGPDTPEPRELHARHTAASLATRLEQMRPALPAQAQREGADGLVLALGAVPLADGQAPALLLPCQLAVAAGGELLLKATGELPVVNELALRAGVLPSVQSAAQWERFAAACPNLISGTAVLVPLPWALLGEWALVQRLAHGGVPAPAPGVVAAPPGLKLDDGQAATLEALAGGRSVILGSQDPAWTARTLGALAVRSMSQRRGVIAVARQPEALTAMRDALDTLGLDRLVLPLYGEHCQALPAAVEAALNAPPPPAAEVPSGSEEQTAWRAELDHWSRLAYQPLGATGRTPAQLAAALLRHQGTTSAPVQRPPAHDWTNVTLDNIERAAAALAASLSQLAPPQSHPFATSRRVSLTAPEEQALAAHFDAWIAAADTVLRTAGAIRQRLGVTTTAVSTEVLRQWLDALVTWQSARLPLPAEWPPVAQWDELAELARQGAAVQRLRALLPGLARVPRVDEIEETRHRLVRQSGRKTPGRSDQRQLQQLLHELVPGLERLDEQQQALTLERLLGLAAGETVLQEGANAARRLAGPLWQEQATDWQRLALFSAAGRGLAEAIGGGLLPLAAGAAPQLADLLAELTAAFSLLGSHRERALAGCQFTAAEHVARELAKLPAAEQLTWARQRRAALHQLRVLCECNAGAALLQAHGLGHWAEQALQGTVPAAELLTQVRHAAASALAQLARESRPALAQFDPQRYRETQRRWAEATAQRPEQGWHNALREHWEALPAEDAPERAHLLAALSEPAAPRRLLATAGRTLTDLFPIVLATPGALYGLLPAGLPLAAVCVLDADGWTAAGAAGLAALAPALAAVTGGEEATADSFTGLLHQHGATAIRAGQQPRSELALAVAEWLRDRGYAVRRGSGAAELLVCEAGREQPLLELLTVPAPGTVSAPGAGSASAAAYALAVPHWLLQPEQEGQQLLTALHLERRRAPAAATLRAVPPYRVYEGCRVPEPAGQGAGQHLARLETAELVAWVAEIAAVEGPVHMALVARRIAQRAGLTRLGSRSLAALETAFLTACREGRLHSQGNFVALPGQPAQPRDRRGLPAAQRRWEFVHPGELTALVRLLRAAGEQGDAAVIAGRMVQLLGVEPPPAEVWEQLIGWLAEPKAAPHQAAVGPG